MPSKYQSGSGRPDFELFGNVLTLLEAATATGLSSTVIRSAIKDGSLASFTPGRRPAGTAGRGMGYRVHKADLQRWFLGEEKDANPS